MRSTDKLAVACAIGLLAAIGCAIILATYEHDDPRKDEWKWQSWDQENLKKGDSGCPSSIYIAPNGVLEQC
jgi:hypothetical protein